MYQVDALGLLDGNSTDEEHVRDVAFDASGAMYLVGATSSSDFPVTAGALDTTYGTGGASLGTAGPMDGFVVKIDPQGQIVWATYLGGPNFERAYAVEVDDAGAIYVAGRAGEGFPTTSGALQENFLDDTGPNTRYGKQDGFIAKLAPDGKSLIWATYFGGTGLGFVRDIDVDAQGRVHIAAHIAGTSPYITSDADRANRLGVNDALYAVLSADGASISYATYMGGTSTGGGFSSNPSVRVTSDGGAYFVYYDNADDVPVSATAYQKTRNGGFDIVLSRITPQRAIDWTTYLGGSQNEDLETHSLTIDANGRPVVGGRTFSNDFPVTANTVQTVTGSTSEADGFISILSATGDQLIASTYFGGTQRDEVEGLAVLSDGKIIVSGSTRSNFLPVDAASFQASPGGGKDGFMASFSSDLTSTFYATYFGGTGDDALRTIEVGPNDEAAIGGDTTSSSFPTVNSADIVVNGQFGAVYGRLTLQ